MSKGERSVSPIGSFQQILGAWEPEESLVNQPNQERPFGAPSPAVKTITNEKLAKDFFFEPFH